MVTRTAADPTATTSGTSSSSTVNALPRGRLGRSTLTSDSSTTATILAICTVQPTVAGTRTLHIHGIVTVRTNIAGGVQVALYKDGTQIQRKNLATLGAGVDYSCSIEVEDQPADGAPSYDLAVGVSGGAGNVVHAVANGATGTYGVCALYVDDVGPAYS